MANVQAQGFLPFASRVAGAPIGRKRVRVLTNNTTAIAYGDAVAKQTDGGWIVIGTGTVSVSSVAQGASYVVSGERVERHHLPAATLYTSSGVDPANASFIYVVEDPVNTLFESSVDEAIGMTDMGINYAVVLGTFSATTGYSGHELDATGRGTGTSLPFRVNDFIRGRADNDPDAADARVICMIAEGSAAAGLDAPALSTTGT